jgi:predicted HTH domain antitoxin
VGRTRAHMTEPPPGREAVCEIRGKVVRTMSELEMEIAIFLISILGAIIAGEIASEREIRKFDEEMRRRGKRK